MKSHIEYVCLIPYLLLWLLAVPAFAQVQAGGLNLSLTGDLGVGYTADYGSVQSSDHSASINGDASLTGYYYNPNFLRFSVTPNYNRSQENSGGQSITDATNVSASVGFFGGSHFPGSFSYGKSINASGTFGLPGVQGLSTHGNATSWGLGWSELVPGLPPVSVQYMQQNSSTTLFGSDQNDTSGTRTLSLQSGYRLYGWQTRAQFIDTHAHADIPAFLATGQSAISDDSSLNFSLDTSHKLPLQGSAYLNYSYGSFYGGSGYGASSSSSDQSISGTASFNPWTRLSTSVQAEYDTNLTGVVQQQLVSAGSTLEAASLGNSHSLSLSSFSTVGILPGLSAGFTASHTQQAVYGQSVSVNNFSAMIFYSFHKPFLGSFTVFGGANDQASNAGNQGAGLQAGLNFDRRIFKWDLGASFSYAQNVQTVLAATVSSDYTYTASARRRMGRNLLWYSNFSGFHTGLGQIQGSSSHSENYNTNFMFKNYTVGAGYGDSVGTSLVTPTGLVGAPVAITPVLSGNQYLLVNGTAYSFNVSVVPVPRWTFGASYNKSQDTTTAISANSVNSSRTILAFTQYQLRKVYLNGGYTNLLQSVGVQGGAPASYSSFYIGIQRWFNLF